LSGFSRTGDLPGDCQAVFSSRPASQGQPARFADKTPQTNRVAFRRPVRPNTPDQAIDPVKRQTRVSDEKNTLRQDNQAGLWRGSEVEMCSANVGSHPSGQKKSPGPAGYWSRVKEDRIVGLLFGCDLRAQNLRARYRA